MGLISVENLKNAIYGLPINLRYIYTRVSSLGLMHWLSHHLGAITNFRGQLGLNFQYTASRGTICRVTVTHYLGHFSMSYKGAHLLGAIT